MSETYINYRLRRLVASRNELMGQPKRLEENLEKGDSAITAIAKKCNDKGIDKIVIIGCGDSFFAGVSVRHALGCFTGLPIDIFQAHEFTKYYFESCTSKTIVICVSSSGTTPIVLEGAKKAKARGAMTIALTNTFGSPIVYQTDDTIMLYATREGWPTQSSTSLMGLLLNFAVRLGELIGGNSAISYKEAYQVLLELPGKMEKVLTEFDERALALAKEIMMKNIYFFIGGGPNLGTANFGSAKVKEMTQDHAVTIQVEEFHHYDWSVHENDVAFLIDPMGVGYTRAVETAEFVKRLNGKLVSIVPHSAKQIIGLSNWVFEMDAVPEWISPMIYVLPLHLVIQHLSILKVAYGMPGPLK